MSHSLAPPEDICVVRLSAIGDTCHALAVVRNLQDNWPECRITWIIGKTESTLMADIAGVEFIIFDKSKGRAAYDDLRRALNGRRFDVALCMHASMRANKINRMLRAPVRLGFDWKRARDFQWLSTNRRIPAAAGEHALDAMMGFARYIGAESRPIRWDIPLSDPDFSFAERYCHQPTIVISPCSSQRSRNFRNWPANRYVAVATYAQDNYDCRILLTGGPTELEQEYARDIATLTGGNIVNLVGQTTLKQLVAVFRAADALLCPDSGPAHLATAVTTPVIGLYATSNPARTGPYVSRLLTVDRYPEALEKFTGKTVDHVRWGQRVRHADAMDLIMIGDVTAKLDMVFG
ncbi:MAG: glycosyltransferase family 9 protein [Woeseiaceae bacterium]